MLLANVYMLVQPAGKIIISLLIFGIYALSEILLLWLMRVLIDILQVN